MSQDLVTNFTPGDRLVSFGADGAPDEVGDSLIFTGIALASVPCDLGTAMEDELLQEFDDQGGAIERHPSLPNAASLDGALGLYYGAAWRITHCPGSPEKWAPRLAAHQRFLREHDNALNLGETKWKMEPGFNYLIDRLVEGKKIAARQETLAGEVAGWAGAVMAEKAACYRLNLGMIALQTLELLGDDPPRGAFCLASRGAEIPALDQWCGRGSIEPYIDAWQHDQWVYRHQRCGGWETPDGNGRRIPPLDLLIAMRQAYNF